MSSKSGYTTNTLRALRFSMGFLIAIGLILVEIGIAEIYLEKDIRCREALPTGRIILDPFTECTSEVGIYFLRALSRGPFSGEGSQVPEMLAWLILAVSYGLIAGFLAQFPRRTALVAFGVLHLLALVSFTMIAFASTFIA